MSEPYEEREVSQPDRLAQAIAEAGIRVDCAFVPHHLSRAAKDKNKSIQWKATISHPDKPGKAFTIDYGQGIGHIPYLPPRRDIIYWDAVTEAAEHGRYFPKGWRHASVNLPKPSSEDVIWALLMDCSALDYHLYEDWAEELGYELDSRENERIYNECRNNGVSLIKLVGQAAVDRLRAAAEDF